MAVCPHCHAALPANASRCPSCGPAEADGWQQVFDAAMERLAEQDYEGTIRRLSQALVLAPDEALGRIYGPRGYAFFRLGQYERAIEDCGEALARNPRDVEALAWRGSAHASLLHWREAIEDCLAAIHWAPEKAEDYVPLLVAYADQAIGELTRETRAGAGGEAFFARGLAFLAKTNFDRAAADFRHAIANGVDDAAAHARLAASLLGLGKLKAAVEAAGEAIQRELPGPDAYATRAQAFANGGLHGKAVADYTRAIEAEPEYYEWYQLRAESWVALYKYPRAARDIARAIELSKSAGPLYLTRARIRGLMEEWPLAAADYAEAIRLGEDAPAVYVQRGEALVAAGAFDEAMDCFDEAFHLDPQCAEAFRGRARAHMARGEWERAKGEVNKALRLSAKFATGYETRGDIHAALGEHDAAEKDYAKTLELDPSHSTAAAVHFRRGQSLLAAGRSKEAVSAFAETIARNEQHAEAHAAKAMALADLRRYSDAIAFGGQAMALDPTKAAEFCGDFKTWLRAAVSAFQKEIANDAKAWRPHRDRGMAQEMLGDDPAAVKDFTAALKIQPSDIPTRLHRADILRRHGRFDAAAKDLEQAIAAGDRRAVVYYDRARCYAALERRQAALKDALVAAEGAPDLQDLSFFIGTLRAELGDAKGAAAEFSAALKREPQHVEALRWRARQWTILGQLPAAAADWDAVIASPSATADDWLSRGRLNVRRDRLEAAAADFDTAKKRDERLIAAYVERALCYARGGRPQRSLIELTKVASRIQFDARFAAAFDARGRVYYNMGQFDRAAGDHNVVLQLQPDDYDFSETWYGKALAHAQLKQWERSQECLEKACNLRREWPAAERLLKWMKAGRKGNVPKELSPPKLKTELRLPPVIGPPVRVEGDKEDWTVDAAWDQWLVRTSGGKPFGPATKADLDQWVAQGRMHDSYQVWRIDWDDYRQAGELYFALRKHSRAKTNRPILLTEAPPEELAVEKATSDDFTLDIGPPRTADEDGPPVIDIRQN